MQMCLGFEWESASTYLLKRKGDPSKSARIFYYRTDDLWSKNQKFDFLSECQHVGAIPWQDIQPDTRHTWLTEGLHAEFDTFIPMGTKETKTAKGKAIGVIFKTYSSGVKPIVMLGLTTSTKTLSLKT